MPRNPDLDAHAHGVFSYEPPEIRMRTFGLSEFDDAAEGWENRILGVIVRWLEEHPHARALTISLEFEIEIPHGRTPGEKLLSAIGLHPDPTVDQPRLTGRAHLVYSDVSEYTAADAADETDEVLRRLLEPEEQPGE